MRLLIIMFCLSISGVVAGQAIPNNKIVGEWLTEKVTFLHDPTLPDTTSQESRMLFKMSRESFANASFVFGRDGLFGVRLPKGVKNMLTGELLAMNGKKWSMDSTNTIHIGGEENLMSIEVRKERGKTLFHLYETPVVLMMSRIER